MMSLTGVICVKMRRVSRIQGSFGQLPKEVFLLDLADIVRFMASSIGVLAR